MGRMNSPAINARESRFVLSAFVMRQIMTLSGFGILALLTVGVVALSTWDVSDPSLSHATGREPNNLLGHNGAIFSDLMMQFFGLAGLIALLPLMAWALSLIAGKRVTRIPARLAAWLGGAFLASASLGCFAPPETWPLPNGIGGVIGDMILRFPALFLGAYPSGTAATALGSILGFAAVILLLIASGFILSNEVPDDYLLGKDKKSTEKHQAPIAFDEEDGDERESFFSRFTAFGALYHYWYIMQARLRRLFRIKPKSARGDFEQPYDFNARDMEPPQEQSRLKKAMTSLDQREEPSFGGQTSNRAPSAQRVRSYSEPSAFDDDDDVLPDGVLSDMDDYPAAKRSKQARDIQVTIPTARVNPSNRSQREAQTSFLAADGFQLPAIHLLAEPKNVARDTSLSEDALEQNARLLEGVLEDFGVKGEIIHVRPGPVVTLYELEPAPGIKSSRVIGLADDIARSMSAIAARVAVVPGRNAIGIELPNRTRETVFLREMIGSRDFESNKAKLPMALGKTIGGEPVIADLSKMPHLLVAGTTGSGKSVAINTMILSLLYRMTPEQCRLIMIDPKMLELSIYDGIPHLLSPVVTDPKKAVVALKWTVREMEERYKKMSKIGVRNIDGFNSRVQQALDKGEVLTRTVQTGFDRQTGEAVYETEEFDLKPLPYIVVIIDEMADLMMVAGKDIEGAVQRLAQMARAAGIHVIMATQRPSVDVITGTIKANFPTRISFQVTSKIDSRTILGEQGAEQLLGMGDMLYMAGGGRIQRVHGPFVSDNEVEEIVAYLKSQGSPDYLEAVTIEDDEDGDGTGPAGTSNLADSNDPYDQAVAIVLRDGKASTSYVQRRLGIGYNRAASLIERMEQEGIIGPANHAGKREILVPTEADILER
jgi:S-DNA-T family DNA segregation ATPase FtsK/SpoIIIE